MMWYVKPVLVECEDWHARTLCHEWSKNSVELCFVIVQGETQSLMAAADLAITKSGSVNLELALHNVSMQFSQVFYTFVIFS